MRTQRNYYEILGLTRTASIQEVKKRYRELARKYHPDVVADKALGEKAFVQITEAYKTLVDPEKRRAYDLTLADVAPPVHSNPAGTYRPTDAARPRAGQRTQIDRLIRDAEFAFIRRRLNEATELCRQAIRLDRTCARAHAILGDIYRLKRMYENAINEYNYAIQFNPGDMDTEAKLEKLLVRSDPVTFSWEAPDGRLSNEAIILNMIGWTTAIFVLLVINIFPGNPIPWLASLHLPVSVNWTWNLVGIIFGDGALVGFLLSMNRIIEDPDDELIFETGGRGWGILPTGFLLLLFSPVFFLGAAVLYFFVGFMQDTISRSVTIVFTAVMTIVLIAALMYPTDKISVVLLGGNVVFIGMLVGWYIGSIMRTG